MKQKLRQTQFYKLTLTYVTGFSVIAILLLTIWMSINNSKKAEGSSNEAIPAGSYIINMGITPQTTGNGLKPYGLIYDLIRNYNVPVKWVINGSKTKDGIDFTYNSVNYKGGPFIIPAEFITPSVAAAITLWNSRGVQGIYTTSEVTVPVYTTLTSFPRVMIDSLASLQNVAIAYYDSAGIPSSAYTVGAPAGLGTCYDLWTNPHGDPTWNTHYYLYNFVTVQKSYIWAECHSVSMMEACRSVVLPVTQLNFLSTTGLQCYGANKCTGITTSHAKPATSPFTYYFPVDPIMQFMGNMHEATSAGSEQWYIPDPSGQWRGTTKRGVITSNGSSPKEGAAIVYGPAYGDASNGWVMYEGGHDLGTSGSSASDRVSAVRAYLNFALLAGKAKQPELNLTMNASIQPGGTNIVSAVATSGTPPYTYQWLSTNGGTFGNSNSANTTYTAPNLSNGSIDVVKVVITDACGRKNFAWTFVTISSSALPIELISFNGKRKNDDILLNFATAMEHNNDYFTIERSQDGVNFTAITKIKSQGNANTLRNYEYTDKSAPDVLLYYRLKQTDEDGKTKTFNTIAVQNKITKLSLLSIMPNPFVDQFNISLSSKESADIEISLVDSKGSKVKTKIYHIDTGTNLLLFNPECSMPSGIYLLLIMQNNKLITSSKVICK